MKEKVRIVCSTILDIFFPRRKWEKLSHEELTRLKLRTDETLSCSITHFFPYRHPLVRRALWQVKYHGSRELITLFAQSMYEEILGDVSENTVGIHKILLVPIPASPGRQQEKGFNQTELLTQALMKLDTGAMFAYIPNTLIKVRETIPQSKTRSRNERLQNLRNAYQVTNKDALQDFSSCIIIDDIYTTGATIEEAYRALTHAGAKHISAYTLAH